LCAGIRLRGRARATRSQVAVRLSRVWSAEAHRSAMCSTSFVSLMSITLRNVVPVSLACQIHVSSSCGTSGIGRRGDADVCRSRRMDTIGGCQPARGGFWQAALVGHETHPHIRANPAPGTGRNGRPAPIDSSAPSALFCFPRKNSPATHGWKGSTESALEAIGRRSCTTPCVRCAGEPLRSPRRSLR